MPCLLPRCNFARDAPNRTPAGVREVLSADPGHASGVDGQERLGVGGSEPGVGRQPYDGDIRRGGAGSADPIGRWFANGPRSHRCS